MKILFLGGTGIISTACSQLAVARGHEVALLNRSRRETIPGAQTIIADIAEGNVADAIGGQRWDAVVDFIAFDAVHGKPLWHSRIGNVSNAPQTYLVDGRQHVLVAAGDRLYSFALY